MNLVTLIMGYCNQISNLYTSDCVKLRSGRIARVRVAWMKYVIRPRLNGGSDNRRPSGE